MKSFCLLFLFSLIGLLLAQGITTPESFFPWGCGNGDSSNQFIGTDCGVTTPGQVAYALDFVPTNFYGEERTGMITVAFRGAIGWGIMGVLETINLDTIGGPSIALYLANHEMDPTVLAVPTQRNDTLHYYFRTDSTPATLERAEEVLFAATKYIYTVTDTLIATWPAAPSPNAIAPGNNQVNQYQVVLMVTDNGQTFALLNYGQIDWCNSFDDMGSIPPGTPADIGFTNAATPTRDQLTLDGSSDFSCLGQMDLAVTSTHADLDLGQHLYDVSDNPPRVADVNPNPPLPLEECSYLGYTMPEIDRALLCHVNTECLEPLLEAAIDRLSSLSELVSTASYDQLDAEGVDLGSVIDSIHEFCGQPPCDLDAFERSQRKFVTALRTLPLAEELCEVNNFPN